MHGRWSRKQYSDRMSRAFAIAAGGGGDAITASVLANMLPDRSIQAVAAYSWDRLIVDPRAGPRTRPDFDGLEELASGVSRITSSTRLRGAGRSTLPDLAGQLRLPLILLDPSRGVRGLARAIRESAHYFDCDQLIVVDVGGDILAGGHEPGLRSPIADFLSLAAAVESGLSTEILVTGLGLDSELNSDEMHARLEVLNARSSGRLTSTHYAEIENVFEWHPSEANGLLYAAANGHLGYVETRDHGGPIRLADDCTVVYRVDAQATADSSPAAELCDTNSLAEAEHAIRSRVGRSEIDYERDKAERIRSAAAPFSVDEARHAIDQYAQQAASRHADYVTVRRIAEVAGVTSPEAMTELRSWLRRYRRSQYLPPLYRTATENAGHAR